MDLWPEDLSAVFFCSQHSRSPGVHAFREHSAHSHPFRFKNLTTQLNLTLHRCHWLGSIALRVWMVETPPEVTIKTLSSCDHRVKDAHSTRRRTVNPRTLFIWP
jgi:hypothetical protein